MSVLDLEPPVKDGAVETAPSRLAGAALLRSVAGLLSRVTVILLEAGPSLAILVLIATILEAALAIGSLYAIKLLVDAMTPALQGRAAIEQVYWALGLVVATLILSAIVGAAAGYVRLKQGFIVRDLMDAKIHAQAIAADLIFFESPFYYDSLQRAREAGPERPAQVASNLLSLLRSSVMLVGILALLAAIEWRLLPVLFATVGLALLVRLSASRRMFAWRMRRAQNERRAGYLDWILTSNLHAKEIRTGNLGAHFGSLYSELRRGLKDEHLALERGRIRGDLVVTLLSALAFGGVAAFLVHEALAGLISVGEVVLFVLLLRRAESSGNEAVSGAARLVDDYLYLSRLFGFLDTRPGIVARSTGAKTVPPLSTTGIVCQDLGFNYEGAERPSLNGISLALRPGQITALVGENGSGKTTLIKLLTRLYDPTQGRITLDGRDVREFDPVAYRALFSVIFQDFAAYPASVADNIHYGDVRLPANIGLVEDAAHRAGAHAFIERLPRRYQTQLTKLFDDGHDLSIGQWQRLALSRSLFPQSQFVIMDEPTSAVDPAAESELFENFRERLAGRGALVISHRLSTVRQADYTYVLVDGQIAEEGTHDKLIARHGAYARLFLQQAKNYRT